jgi:hypothetical protein
MFFSLEHCKYLIPEYSCMIYLDFMLSLFYSKRLCYSIKHTTNTTELVYELHVFLVRMYML